MACLKRIPGQGSDARLLRERRLQGAPGMGHERIRGTMGGEDKSVFLRVEIPWHLFSCCCFIMIHEDASFCGRSDGREKKEERRRET